MCLLFHECLLLNVSPIESTEVSKAQDRSSAKVLPRLMDKHAMLYHPTAVLYFVPTLVSASLIMFVIDVVETFIGAVYSSES